MNQDPFKRPTAKRPKRSPRPQFHAASKEALDELREELAKFIRSGRGLTFATGC